MSKIKLIETENAVLPFGHYSQATVHNGTIYVAGLLGVFEHDKTYVGTIAEQTEQALKNLSAILEAAQSDLQHLLTVTIFVTNLNDWSTINEVYARFLGEHKPARAVIGAASLPKGFQLEIMATAAVK